MSMTSRSSFPEGISVPLLTLGMTGHWEYLASETIYDYIDKWLSRPGRFLGVNR
jgi:hypothetical protein